MIRIAVLASGGGTNLQSLLDASHEGKLPHGTIVLVASDKTDAYALKRAELRGIPSVGLDKRQRKRAGFEQALLDLLASYRVELVVLAGFLTILSGDVIKAYEGRILNIHPSLIPSFCGKGYYGRRVHEAALQRGVKISGATVHLVTEEADAGPIIAQRALDVLPDDTPESLASRILQTIEWKLLPEAVEHVCQVLEQSMDLKTALQAQRYPGRGILCGVNDEGRSIVAYFITARSSHSKNRRLVSEGGVVRTEAIDERLVTDPSLIIYRAMDTYKRQLVVANGDHSDTILAALVEGKQMEEALKDRSYEPDKPAYTSRISAVVELAQKGGYTLSILRRRKGECERAYFPYPNPMKGKGHLIHTYQGDGEPLPPFLGSPKEVVLQGNGATLGKEIWGLLDPEYRVALCVRETNLSTGSFELYLINAEQGR
ncbi:MAG: phosphoribosylglycinamide formyltransferase [Sphaerochaeta sp.]